MAEFTQQQRKQMTPQSQQLENKNLTEIWNIAPRGKANADQRKLRQDMEATKPQPP